MAASAGELGAAMAADIHEGAQLAGCVARDEDRHWREILGQVVAGIGNLGAEAGDDRMMAEEHVPLASSALGRCVRGGVVAGESLGHRRRASVDVDEDLVDEVDLGRVLHRRFIPPLVVRSTRTTTGSFVPSNLVFVETLGWVTKAGKVGAYS